jgi:hypothetical protein
MVGVHHGAGFEEPKVKNVRILMYPPKARVRGERYENRAPGLAFPNALAAATP